MIMDYEKALEAESIRVSTEGGGSIKVIEFADAIKVCKQMTEENQKKCKWKFSYASPSMHNQDYDEWDSECGNSLTLMGTPERNDMKYCPFCRKEIC